MSKRMNQREAALAIVKLLRDKGHEAYWAGGAVRDMLLGHATNDFDIATDARPERVVELFSKTRKVGVQFGVVLVKQGRHWLEVATFRTDVDYEDGRHPQHVVFTTAEEDARRRDFTINGLFFDPIANEVIDYVGGQADLEAGIIRAIGVPAERFEEDHLRMLRGVRFSARLGFPIEPTTAKEIRIHAFQIKRISPERILDELIKMLANSNRADAIRLAGELSLLDHLWPDAVWTEGQVDRAVRVLAALPPESDAVEGLAALLIEADAEELRRVGRCLHASNQQIDETAWLRERVADLDDAATMSLPAIKKLIANERFHSLLKLHRAVCEASGRSVEANDAARRRHDAIPRDDVAPPPLVTGDDLIELGLKPSPRFKEILTELYDEQLDNRLPDREAALERLREVVTDDAP